MTSKIKARGSTEIVPVAAPKTGKTGKEKEVSCGYNEHNYPYVVEQLAIKRIDLQS